MSRDIKNQMIAFSLNRIKDAVRKGNVFFVPREVNKQALLDYSLSVADVNQIILGLSTNDYHKGPEDDHDGSDGFIWVFTHPVSGCVMYIKLKLFDVSNEEYVKVLSFHD